MWGSLRSSTGSTFGDAHRASGSSQGGDSGGGGGTSSPGSRLSGATSLISRPRASISSILSSAVGVGGHPGGGGGDGGRGREEEEEMLDNEAVTHMESFFGKLNEYLYVNGD